MKKYLGFFAGVLLASQPVMAFEFDQENVYGGAGLSSNGMDVTGADVSRAIGWQIFAGYDLEDVELADDLSTAIEVGYMTSGDFEYTTASTTILGVTVPGTTVKLGSVDGLWATGVFTYPVADQVEVLGRIGLDFGDDDGLMYGFGGSYQLNDQIDVRAEYVLRDNTNSLQLNAVYRF